MNIILILIILLADDEDPTGRMEAIVDDYYKECRDKEQGGEEPEDLRDIEVPSI